MSELRRRHHCVDSWKSGTYVVRLYRVANNFGVVVTPHETVTALFTVQLVKFEDEDNNRLWTLTGLEHHDMTEDEVEKLLTTMENV